VRLADELSEGSGKRQKVSLVERAPITFSTRGSSSGSGCDEEGMSDLPFGSVRRLLDGGVFAYKCQEGAEMEGGPALIVCDGQSWNDTKPKCTSEYSYGMRLPYVL